MAEMHTLGWADYLVITIMLCISVGIGIYYRFSGGRQKTMEVRTFLNNNNNNNRKPDTYWDAYQLSELLVQKGFPYVV